MSSLCQTISVIHIKNVQKVKKFLMVGFNQNKVSQFVHLIFYIYLPDMEKVAIMAITDRGRILKLRKP